MKILLATSKPFAKVAVDGIREIVADAGFELAVTADERYGIALCEHLRAVLHLPGLDHKALGDVIDVYFLHN